MNTRRLVAFIAVVLGIVWSVVPALAETTNTVQVKATHHIVSAQLLPAGDEEGHAVGMGQRAGEAAFSTGEVAKYSSAFIFDAHLGKGSTAQGYTKLAFDDGSMIFVSWTSETADDKDGLQSLKGQGTLFKGVGRFEGIKGTAVFSGKQQRPTSEDPKRTVVHNATLTYTLP